MKKRIISLLLVTTLIIASGMLSFAETEKGEKTSNSNSIVPTMEFTGEAIQLSLNDAIKNMQTKGTEAEAAELNKEYNKAVADGYAESSSSYRKMLSDYGTDIMDDTADAAVEGKVSRLRRDFAKNNIDNNYKAEMNRIENGTVLSYYSILQAKQDLKVAEDNLKIQKDILKVVQKKYDLGTASKNDLLSAKTAVTIAESSLKNVDTQLRNEKMKFNISMGYPVMQEVNFTDSLKEMPVPTVTLTEAIHSALKNRMEIKSSELGLEVQKIYLDHMKYTISIRSSKYAKLNAEIMKLEQELKNQPLKIEQEIRSKYMDVQVKKSSLESAKASLNFAQESYRIAMISYDAGLKTLTEVQQEQNKVFESSQAVGTAITNYDLAVYALQYAQGVGTEAISL